MSTSNIKLTNSPHWNKIFKRAYLQNNKSEQKKREADKYKKYFKSNAYEITKCANEESFESNSIVSSNKSNYSCSKSNSTLSSNQNENKSYYDLNELNFDQLSILKNENEKYINNSESIIKLAYDAYTGILLEVSNFKVKLIEFNEKLKTRKENDDTDPDFTAKIHKLAKKEYNDILYFFYQNLLNFIKLQSVNDQSEKITALFELNPNEKNNVRNVSLTYVASGGIVIDDCIAKIDNIYVDDSCDKIIFQIGKCKFPIKKSETISQFNITKLREKIVKLLNNLFYIEKEIDKNIKILLHSLEIIEVIKNNLGIVKKNL